MCSIIVKIRSEIIFISKVALLLFAAKVQPNVKFLYHYTKHKQSHWYCPLSHSPVCVCTSDRCCMNESRCHVMNLSVCHWPDCHPVCSRLSLLSVHPYPKPQRARWTSSCCVQLSLFVFQTNMFAVTTHRRPRESHLSLLPSVAWWSCLTHVTFRSLEVKN